MSTNNAFEFAVPRWLSNEAAAEYNRVVDEAKKMNQLDKLNLVALTLYADSYDKYHKAVKKVQEFGVVMVVEDKLCLLPFIGIAKKMAAQVLTYSAKLGIATSDRMTAIMAKMKLMFPTQEAMSIWQVAN